MNNLLPFGFGMAIPAWAPTVGAGLIVIVLWSIFWKGLALWHSAKRSQPHWFCVLLVVNTAGLLEIAYLFFILKLKASDLFS